MAVEKYPFLISIFNNVFQITECTDVLVRYLDNIIGNPTETKFHKIRCSNATFRDKVSPILGATELLFAAGFQPTKLENNGVEEDFWVFNPENIEGIQVLEVSSSNLQLNKVDYIVYSF